MSFPRYPKYKESGVEWLGEVPEHWEVVKMKWIARMESGHTPDKKIPEYWENGEIPWVSLNDTNYLKDNEYIADTAYRITELGIANSSARLLPPSAVVFSRDATIGRCAITTRPMAVSQHFIAWLCSESMMPEFLLLRLRSMTGELDRLTTGATLKTIGMPDVRTLVTPVPPLEEQQAIIHWVSCETAKIDELVREKRRLMELLKEKCQAFIYEAVTQGMNPHASMKPSGSKWLGDVPEHWVVKKLAYLLSEPPRNGTSPEITADGSTPTFSIAAVRNGFVDIESHLKYVSIDLKDAQPYFVKQQEIFVLRGNGSKDLVGTAGIVTVTPPANCIYPDILIRIRPNSLILPSYLVTSLNSLALRPQIQIAAQTAAGIWKISGSALQALRLPLPPLEEQHEIVRHVQSHSSALDTLTAEAQRAIDLLQERRTALISAAVTGQIDVRPFAERQSA